MDRDFAGFLRNYAAEMAMVWLSVAAYHFAGYYRDFLDPYTKTILVALAAVYTAAAVPMVHYAAIRGRSSKGYLLFSGLLKAVLAIAGRRESGPGQEERLAIGSFLVKFYFIPMMMNITYRHVHYLAENYGMLLHSDPEASLLSYFNGSVYPLLISVLYTFFTAVFTFGYLTDSGLLGNRIKSVEPTLLGWAVTLVCYSPFAAWFSLVVPFRPEYMADFGHEGLTFAARLVVLLLMVVILSCVLALGAKCSNLTNRGIVTGGPFRYIRHPQYTAKNLKWWICVLPAVPDNPMVLLYLGIWSWIYYLRSVTEERHLMSDPDYRAYCEKVKYRFVPFVV